MHAADTFLNSGMLQSVQSRMGRVAYRLWLLWIAGVLLLPNARAVAGPPQYRFDVWTAESGLPQNIVRGVAQTMDGYIWVATLDGVARFDGVRFTLFNKSNTPGIASNRFSSMVDSRDGDLWLSNENGGITRYHQGSFHTYTAEDGIPANSVRGITTDGAGDLWILSEEAIFLWNKTTGQLLDVTPDGFRIHYEDLAWDSAGFWGIDNTGLHIFIQGHLVSYPLAGLPAGRSISAVGVDNNGGVWLKDTNQRLSFIPVGKQAARPVDPAHPQSFSYRDPHGHIWTMHVEGRLSRFLDFESSGQPASIQLDRFLEDREGNVWIGTEGKGLYKLQEQSIHVYSASQGLRDGDIYPVYQDRSGSIWAGSWHSGLSRFSNGRFDYSGVPQVLSDRAISALTEDRQGNLWVATLSNLGILRDGQLRKPSGILIPERAMVQAMIQDRGGTLWIGTSNGLVLYRDGPGKTLTVQDGLATNDVRTIVESPSGEIWIGGYGGLTRLRDGQFTRWSERDGLPSDNVRAIYQDREDVIWIGTYDGGLGRIKDGKLTRYRERDGLFSNGVFQILEDGRGNLWMSCNRGIYRVSKQELNAFADGKLARITSVAYGKSDGMLDVECNGGMWPAGIRSQDGKLWFPTQDGLAEIDPNTVRINPQPPPVVIETALLDRVPTAFLGSLNIAPDKQNLEIEYTALSFIHSEQIRFRYKLEGLDSAWIDAGARRTAYYSHLPSGTYQFHVIACNSDGVWNEVGQTLTIDVLAPFYLARWFIALEALAVIALIVLAVRYRLSQLERAQALQKAFSQQLIASQEKERQRIAAELHDGLGQRLVVINNLALFSMRSQKAAAAEGGLIALKEISAETALAIQDTRDISYNLRPFQLDRLGLTKAIEGVLRSVAAASGIRIVSELADIDDAFPEELRINFYRIVQESLNNMMKHSQATEAEVRIARNEERMILSIRDNGNGFTPGNRPAKPGTSGFGLTGMAERANLLGGRFHVWSAPGQGTVTTVEFHLGALDRG